ncbi:hypothetical protein SAMN05444000_11673 [Shimia gijangensis]|uniref:Uncharacterized protein n=1 Tax=Shimia gijangensis TaxID=1470563 RepID=A0A1M6NQP1_9RHOB|nr:hypothetical protein [Shimia gijangensis]SHJ97978.1 hypothetical protein SAMN05444000_11673 [Shimia gijangensis]
MRQLFHFSALTLGAFLVAGMGSTPAPEPMPLACDVLTSLPADKLVAQDLTYQTVQDHETNGIQMSMCSALGADDLPVVTMLLRHDGSDAEPQPVDAQREAMIKSLAETFGQDPTASFPNVGEAALWIAEIKQLTVWDQSGHVMFTLTAPEDLALRIANEIVANLP